MWLLLLRGILSFQSENPPKDTWLEDEGRRGRGLKQEWVFARHSEHVLRDKCDVSYKVSMTSPETVIWIGEQVLTAANGLGLQWYSPVSAQAEAQS